MQALFTDQPGGREQRYEDRPDWSRQETVRTTLPVGGDRDLFREEMQHYVRDEIQRMGALLDRGDFA